MGVRVPISAESPIPVCKTYNVRFGIRVPSPLDPQSPPMDAIYPLLEISKKGNVLAE